MSENDALRDEVGSRERAANVAAGRAAADLVLAGATLVDVFARCLRRADVAFAGDRVAYVGKVAHCQGASTEIVDCTGLYLLPGFVEPHFHAGFSQVSVERLAELLVPHGTVTLGACLSESGAIAGYAAIVDQLNRLRETALDVLLSPHFASALGPGGCSPMDLMSLVDDGRCVEVREWSDPTLMRLTAELCEVWQTAVRRGRRIAGHLAGRSGPELQASVARGVRSDHEAMTVAEVLERVSLGLHVQIRQGSGLRDMRNLLPAITEHGADPDLFSFCSDEQSLDDLATDGHIDGKLRQAVALGLDPIEAVRMATLNAARSMGVDDLYGSVVPARMASVVLVKDLTTFDVQMVFARGRLAAERGAYLWPSDPTPYPAAWRDTVRIGHPLTSSCFRVPASDGPASVRVIGVTPWTAFTEELIETILFRDGRIDGNQEIAKLAIVDRYDGSGRMGLALIRGLQVQNGAVAATINPDAYDIMIVGADDDDMALAANRVAELGGGIVVVADGRIRAELALPLFGIVSDAPLAETVPAASAVAEAIRCWLGSPVKGLVALAGFCCLPAYPNLKLTSKGLIRSDPTGRREQVSLIVRG